MRRQGLKSIAEFLDHRHIILYASVVDKVHYEDDDDDDKCPKLYIPRQWCIPSISCSERTESVSAVDAASAAYFLLTTFVGSYLNVLTLARDAASLNILAFSNSSLLRAFSIWFSNIAKIKQFNTILQAKYNKYIKGRM